MHLRTVHGEGPAPHGRGECWPRCVVPSRKRPRTQLATGTSLRAGGVAGDCLRSGPAVQPVTGPCCGPEISLFGEKPSARQPGLSSHISRLRRRAGTVASSRRCPCSSPSECATRVCRRTCLWASSRKTSRLRFAGARSPNLLHMPSTLPSALPRMSSPSMGRAGIA
jgi:hypothetical protein